MLITLSAFVLNRSHVLSSLILLEYIILSIYLRAVVRHSAPMSDILKIITLFTVSATAAATGLRLLIPLTSSHGHDYFSRFNIL